MDWFWERGAPLAHYARSTENSLPTQTFPLFLLPNAILVTLDRMVSGFGLWPQFKRRRPATLLVDFLARLMPRELSLPRRSPAGFNAQVSAAAD